MFHSSQESRDKNTPSYHTLPTLGIEGFLRREVGQLTDKQGKRGWKRPEKQVQMQGLPTCQSSLKKVYKDYIRGLTNRQKGTMESGFFLWVRSPKLSLPRTHGILSCATLTQQLRDPKEATPGFILSWGDLLCYCVEIFPVSSLLVSRYFIPNIFSDYSWEQVRKGWVPKSTWRIVRQDSKIRGERLLEDYCGMLGCFLFLSLGIYNMMGLTVVCIVLVPLSIYSCLYIHQSLPTLSSSIILFTFLNIFISICITSYYLSICALISYDVNIC